MPWCLVGLLGLGAVVAAVAGARSGTGAPETGWIATTISLPSGSKIVQAEAIGCWSKNGCIIGGFRGQNAATWTQTTMNAGRSWVVQERFPAALAGGVESIACDRRVCFMVGENLAEDADALAFSPNRGRTWSVVSLPQWWVSESITPDLIGCTTRTCVVYGSNIFTISGVKGSFSRYRVGLISTSNDGKTWTQDALPGGSDGLDSVTCIASGRCWALFRSQQPQESVAVSETGGTTWSTVGEVPDGFDPDHFAGFGCASRALCYLVDDSDSVFVTTDGGRTWKERDPVHPGRGSRDIETDTLGCAPNGPCFIVGSGPPASLWSSTGAR